MIPEAGLLPDYPTISDAGALPDRSATIRSRGSPGLFRPLWSDRLLPDYPNDPRSRAAPGLSSLPKLRKAFQRRQERIFMIIIIMTYGNTSHLRTYTPGSNTYDTQ